MLFGKEGHATLYITSLQLYYIYLNIIFSQSCNFIAIMQCPAIVIICRLSVCDARVL